MTIDNSLPPGYNRFRDAVLIVDPGACNPNVAEVTMLRKSRFRLISLRKSRLSAT